MKSVTVVSLALTAAAPVFAFTNGTLIPAYFCNPEPDGMPKALGELIPLLQKDDGGPLAFNADANSNLQVVPMTNSSTPGNAGYIIASLHNTQNAITPLNPGIKVTLAGNATAMVAGKPNQLVLDSMDPNIALDGALMYGLNATGARAGTWSDMGGTFVDFPGCGTNAQGQMAGIVHKQIISCNNTYTQLFYNAPLCGNGMATLMGLSVTDAGFGIWNVTFPVTGQMPFDENSPECVTLTTKPTMEELIEIAIIEEVKVVEGGEGSFLKPRDRVTWRPRNRVTWKS